MVSVGHRREGEGSRGSRRLRYALPSLASVQTQVEVEIAPQLFSSSGPCAPEETVGKHRKSRLSERRG